MPRPQPAYPMEEPAHIFGDRLQLPQRHGFSPTGERSIKSGNGQGNEFVLFSEHFLDREINGVRQGLVGG